MVHYVIRLTSQENHLLMVLNSLFLQIAQVTICLDNNKTKAKSKKFIFISQSCGRRIEPAVICYFARVVQSSYRCAKIDLNKINTHVCSNLAQLYTPVVTLSCFAACSTTSLKTFPTSIAFIFLKKLISH